MQQALSDLVQLGEISITYADGQNGTNRYWVTVRCPDDCDRSTNHRPSVMVRQGGEAHFMGGVKPASGGGVKPTSPKPSGEPSEEPKRIPRRISEDFTPTQEMFDWAANEFPQVDARLETDSFIDYWLSTGKNAAKTDWNRTWKNWIRNVAKRMPANRNRKTSLDQNVDVIRAMKGRD